MAIKERLGKLSNFLEITRSILAWEAMLLSSTPRIDRHWPLQLIQKISLGPATKSIGRRHALAILDMKNVFHEIERSEAASVAAPPSVGRVTVPINLDLTAIMPAPIVNVAPTPPTPVNVSNEVQVPPIQIRIIRRFGVPTRLAGWSTAFMRGYGFFVRNCNGAPASSLGVVYPLPGVGHAYPPFCC
jgi:hypothetical protein